MISGIQIWKIVREKDPEGEPLGYLLVYIDDLLIQAQESAMHSFFKWIAAKWECDSLNVLDYNNPIRFLGMELHRVQGGVELSQEGFVTELLTRSKAQGSRETLLLSVEEEEEALIMGQTQPVQGQ